MFKPGDEVQLINQSDYGSAWQGIMTIVSVRPNSPHYSARHPVRGLGAFDASKLELASPIKAAVNLLISNGYHVQAPYWVTKAVDGQTSDGSKYVLACVDRDSVQLNSPYGSQRMWVSFSDWDNITTVVEEAKAFKRKYR